MKQTIVAYIKISLAMAIVGSSVVAGKLILSSFPIFLASEFRFIIATLILIPLLLWQEKRIPVIKPKVLFILFLQALTGVFLFNIFMLYGLKFTTAIEAGVITSTLPAVIGVISFLFLKERLTMKKITGIIFAVIGVLLMNMISGGTSSVNSLLGNSLILGAVLTEALFITLGKSVSSKVTPLAISTMMSLFGLILFLPFAIYEARNFTFSTVGIMDWLNILYFGVVITVVAFLLMYQGLSKVSASSAGVLTSMLPLSTVILSFLILKEEILFSHVLGMLFVLAAIFILSKESTPEEKESETAISP
ncbi:DMT family transporter [Priestia aryabhattai]|uniref:DMT family transporter n=1 Tax=Priestia aryabhattai TaxID=412384 RepID=UPI001CCF76F5|nr:DMT family transporter [Priestia aryabhattai]MBZ6489450.1 DMT family transporter [Priestia aryabhattai]MDH3111140.1 DMT family transporter [Priestia aryabhattai]MDH3129809.1 DMT family transporter [Priestia aryabhattai]MDH3130286.1 DMT family transporter [Priestia aryabhattai]